MNETTNTILVTCSADGCERPVAVQKWGLCRKCYVRAQNLKHAAAYKSKAAHARSMAPLTPPASLPPSPALPRLPKSASQEQRDQLRLIYYACYRQMRFAPEYAAKCAGYPVQLVERVEFLAGLDRQAEASGVLALLDVPNRLLYATQRHANFSSLVELRDQRDDPRVALTAAKILTDLDNKHAFNPQEIADEEMAGWSKDDLVRYIRDGTVPQRPQKTTLQVFAEDADVGVPDAGIVPDADIEVEGEDAAAHSNRGMLA